MLVPTFFLTYQHFELFILITPAKAEEFRVYYSQRHTAIVIRGMSVRMRATNSFDYCTTARRSQCISRKINLKSTKARQKYCKYGSNLRCGKFWMRVTTPNSIRFHRDCTTFICHGRYVYARMVCKLGHRRHVWQPALVLRGNAASRTQN